MNLKNQPIRYAFANARLAQIANEVGALAPRLFTPINHQDEKTAWLDRAAKGDFTAPEFIYDHDLLVYARALGREFTEMALVHSELSIEYALSCAVPDTNRELLSYVLLLLDERLRSISALFAKADRLWNLCIHSDMQPKIVRRDLNRYEAPLPTDDELARWWSEAECWQPDQQPQGGMFSGGVQRGLKRVELDAAEIVKVFDHVLWQQGYISPLQQRQWRAEVSDAVSAITVSGEQAKILVPPTRKLNAVKLASLIAHEISGHVRARLNAEHLFMQILTDAYGEQTPLLDFVPLLAKSPDESLNEGAAKLNEVTLLGTSKVPAPFYGLAIDLAFRRDADFARVAQQIFELRRAAGVKKSTALNTAWTTAYRVFRAGGTTKDVCYKRGFELLAPLKLGNPELADTLSNYATLAMHEVLELRDRGAALDGIGPEVGRTVFQPSNAAAYWLQSQVARLID